MSMILIDIHIEHVMNVHETPQNMHDIPRNMHDTPLNIHETLYGLMKVSEYHDQK